MRRISHITPRKNIIVACKLRVLNTAGPVANHAMHAFGTLAAARDWPIIWNLDRAPRLECLPQVAGNVTIALEWLPEAGSLFDAHGGAGEPGKVNLTE